MIVRNSRGLLLVAVIAAMFGTEACKKRATSDLDAKANIAGLDLCNVSKANREKMRNGTADERAAEIKRDMFLRSMFKRNAAALVTAFAGDLNVDVVELGRAIDAAGVLPGKLVEMVDGVATLNEVNAEAYGKAVFEGKLDHISVIIEGQKIVVGPTAKLKKPNMSIDMVTFSRAAIAKRREANAQEAGAPAMKIVARDSLARIEAIETSARSFALGFDGNEATNGAEFAKDRFFEVEGLLETTSEYSNAYGAKKGSSGDAAEIRALFAVQLARIGASYLVTAQDASELGVEVGKLQISEAAVKTYAMEAAGLSKTVSKEARGQIISALIQSRVLFESQGQSSKAEWLGSAAIMRELGLSAGELVSRASLAYSEMLEGAVEGGKIETARILAEKMVSFYETNKALLSSNKDMIHDYVRVLNLAISRLSEASIRTAFATLGGAIASASDVDAKIVDGFNASREFVIEGKGGGGFAAIESAYVVTRAKYFSGVLDFDAKGRLEQDIIQAKEISEAAAKSPESRTAVEANGERIAKEGRTAAQIKAAAELQMREFNEALKLAEANAVLTKSAEDIKAEGKESTVKAAEALATRARTAANRAREAQREARFK